MDMSKYSDLINPRNPVPWPQKQYRSWKSGLQMVNCKKIEIFINQTVSGGLNLTADSDLLPKLTFIDDNFAFCLFTFCQLKSQIQMVEYWLFSIVVPTCIIFKFLLVKLIIDMYTCTRTIGRQKESLMFSLTHIQVLH